MAWPFTYGYCDVPDVAARAQGASWSGTTNPTTAQVQQFVTDCAQLIDVRLATLGVTTPITAPANALAALRHWNAMGAAGLAARAVENRVLEPGQRTSGSLYWSDFTRWLNDDGALTDLVGSGDALGDVTTGALLADPDTGEDQGPVFTVRMRF